MNTKIFAERGYRSSGWLRHCLLKHLFRNIESCRFLNSVRVKVWTIVLIIETISLNISHDGVPLHQPSVRPEL